MTLLVDLVKIQITSTGTGPLTLGIALPGFRGVEALTNGAQYSYSIQQNSNYEAGTGIYLSAGQTFSRTPTISSNGGATINLLPSAAIAFTALANQYGNPTSSGISAEELAADSGAMLIGTAESVTVQQALNDRPTSADLIAAGGGNLINLTGLNGAISAEYDGTNPRTFGWLLKSVGNNKTFDGFRIEHSMTGALSNGYAEHIVASADASVVNGGGFGVAIGGAGNTNAAVFNKEDSGSGNGILAQRIGAGFANGWAIFGVSSAGAGSAGGAIDCLKQNSTGAPGGPYGTGPSLRVRNESEEGLAIDSSSASNNASASSHQLRRGNPTGGVNVDVQMIAGGARATTTIGSRSLIQPSTLSTGTPAVIGHDISISANVSGSAAVSGLNISVAAVGGAASYGGVMSVTGNATDQYACYALASGGTNNYAGYFVGQTLHAGNMIVSTDNSFNLGSGGARLKELFCANGTINTSDEREKKWLGEMSPAHLRAARRVIVETGFFQWKADVERKGADGARRHYGVRAQQVVRIFVEEGLEAETPEGARPSFVHGFLCYDEWGDGAPIPLLAQVEREMFDELPVQSGVLDKHANVITATRKVPRVYSQVEKTGLLDKRGKHRTREIARVMTELVMEKVGELPGLTAGGRYGLRVDQFNMFLIAAQEQRLLALEAALTPPSA